MLELLPPHPIWLAANSMITAASMNARRRRLAGMARRPIPSSPRAAPNGNWLGDMPSGSRLAYVIVWSARAASGEIVAFKVNRATAPVGMISGGLNKKPVLLPIVPVIAVCADAPLTEPFMVTLENRFGLLNAKVTVLIVSVDLLVLVTLKVPPRTVWPTSPFETTLEALA
jgi:hypothetical protein